jgi:TFIIF-interacting CTD phosphatase-like protein
MFWNKKEDKKGLPDLPPLKSPSRPFEMPEVEEEPSQSFPEAPEVHVSEAKAPKIKEIEEWNPPATVSEVKTGKKTEDVYVKLDKFHSARKALVHARDKLKELDELMKKIRDTRMREEQELASWEDEINSVKSKVEDVTRNIFEKIE